MKITSTLFLTLSVLCFLDTKKSFCANDQQNSKLNTIIPATRFESHLNLLDPRDTVDPSTATSQKPKTWVAMGAAAMRHVTKNYTESGLVGYVTDSDNPNFFRFLTERSQHETPLEEIIGEHTYEEHLRRGVERSEKAQQLIIDLLKKKDQRGVPTNEGAHLMLRTIDSCYLVIPDMNLMLAKKYLKKFTDTYGEKALFNENILKELTFLPKLLCAAQPKTALPPGSGTKPTQQKPTQPSPSTSSASNPSTNSAAPSESSTPPNPQTTGNENQELVNPPTIPATPHTQLPSASVDEDPPVGAPIPTVPTTPMPSAP